jgi:alpha-ketoglutarate-dependent taurine dioxygenase
MEFYDSVTESPLIDKHPYRDYEVLRFNEPHLETRGRLINPVEMSFKGISAEEIGSFYDEILSFLYDDRFYYAHQWQDNDLVIADNFTLLHGRNAFTSSSNRYLRRVQVLSDPVYNNPGLESYQ